MFQLVLVGAGQRGMIYARYAYDCGLADIVAVAEPDSRRREAAAEILHIPPQRVYASADQLFDQGRLGQAAIIASMDQDHFPQTMRALGLGYEVLLEKPISPDPVECMRISEEAQRRGLGVWVCHVLRYSPYFREIKKVIDSGELGRIVSIQHNENIGNFHMAHAFVRGNWRRAEDSSPIIMQKSCHDMDLLVWLTGSRAKKISSFGGLSYFREENAPEGSAARCLDCGAAEGCRFDARKMYLPVAGSWPATVLTTDQSERGLMKAIKEGPYGRCVWRCDNDVCDHQVSIIEFENGVSATFNLSAFTNRMARTMKIMCEEGEIRVSESENRIELVRFGSTGTAPEDLRLLRPGNSQGSHAGGDAGLMNDFFLSLKSGGDGMATPIARSVESHYMACAAEEARLSGRVVDMEGYRARLKEAIG